MNLSKQYNLTLFVQKIGKETANLLVKRYYQETDKFKVIKPDTGVNQVRKSVAEIEK